MNGRERGKGWRRGKKEEKKRSVIERTKESGEGKAGERGRGKKD